MLFISYLYKLSNFLHTAFDAAQPKLMLNAGKSNFMFSNDKALSSWNWITTCKYLGITTGKNVTFKMHNENLVSQVKFKLALILIPSKKTLDFYNFLPLLDYSDLWMHVAMAKSCLHHCCLHAASFPLVDFCAQIFARAGSFLLVSQYFTKVCPHSQNEMRKNNVFEYPAPHSKKYLCPKCWF